MILAGQSKLRQRRVHKEYPTGGVYAANANSVTSGGSVSSKMAPTMSGASAVRLTMRLT
jgi:hypothetical protein